MGFLLEKLHVYLKALDFAEEIRGLLEDPPSGAGALADQLRRASMSIPLNLAEGSGRWHINDKKQFFWVARGSVNECIPALRLAVGQGIIRPEDNARLRSELALIGKMITNLISSLEKHPK